MYSACESTGVPGGGSDAGSRGDDGVGVRVGAGEEAGAGVSDKISFSENGTSMQQDFARIVIVEAEKPRTVREKLEYFDVAA